MKQGLFFAKIYTIIERTWESKTGGVIDFRSLGFQSDKAAIDNCGERVGGNAMGITRLAQIAKDPNATVTEGTKKRIAAILKLEIHSFDEKNISVEHFNDEYSLEDFKKRFIPNIGIYHDTELHSWVFSKQFAPEYGHESEKAANDTYKTYKQYEKLNRSIYNKGTGEMELVNRINLSVHSVVPNVFSKSKKIHWVVTAKLLFEANEQGVKYTYYGILAPFMQPHMLTWLFDQQDAVDADIITLMTKRHSNKYPENSLVGRDLTVTPEPFETISHRVEILV